jgi:transcriptional regulator of acetoin/glycerol metabolism
VARAFVLYAWPLNVRELVQTLARALPLARDGAIEAVHLPPHLQAAAQSPPDRAEAPSNLSPQEAELRTELVERLERCEGNVAEVAREMKKATIQVYRRMQKLGIDPKVFR